MAPGRDPSVFEARVDAGSEDIEVSRRNEITDHLATHLDPIFGRALGREFLDVALLRLRIRSVGRDQICGESGRDAWKLFLRGSLAGRRTS